ncbi:unnamed protein product [Pleuronectes platessa]|uniref:Uncharacterized protein n=1 Tax=Pleuronectes platessa TaxID=8262 RepID=A0A9N7USI3_PLEPL|nr:unnamed protein product [Pleuronectes platessa]
MKAFIENHYPRLPHNPVGAKGARMKKFVTACAQVRSAPRAPCLQVSHAVVLGHCVVADSNGHFLRLQGLTCRTVELRGFAKTDIRRLARPDTTARSTGRRKEQVEGSVSSSLLVAALTVQVPPELRAALLCALLCAPRCAALRQTVYLGKPRLLQCNVIASGGVFVKHFN